MMMTTNTSRSSSHANCSHEPTKAARAACRKARNTTPVTAPAPKPYHRAPVTMHDCSEYPLDDNDRCTGCGQLPPDFEF